MIYLRKFFPFLPAILASIAAIIWTTDPIATKLRYAADTMLSVHDRSDRVDCETMAEISLSQQKLLIAHADMVEGKNHLARSVFLAAVGVYLFLKTRQRQVDLKAIR